MILLIDNYDSFTYNLVQRIGELRPDDPPVMHVVRNDMITVDEAIEISPSHLLISPGPCTPTESGICPELIKQFMGKIPILGVCLGHQAIGHVHGMVVKRHHTLMHGKTSQIFHDSKGIFKGMSNPFTATRYHSLIIERNTIPLDQFEISAWTDQDEVMGLRWKRLEGNHAPSDGVQFHPESFLTIEGPIMLANFLGIDAPVGLHSV